MKLSEKSNKIKRVYVSIHEHHKVEVGKTNTHTKPPLQISKFIKKKTDSSRSHTPEQNFIRPGSLISKAPGRRSKSPYTTSLQDSSVQIKNSSSLLTMNQISNEDSYCLPYELDSVKTSKLKLSHNSSNSNQKKVDLTPGIFSQKQIISESQLIIRKEKEKEKENSQYFTYPGFHIDECTTVTSRTPSPILPQRNNRCSALSRNFKINKESFVSEVERCGRDSVDALESFRNDSCRALRNDLSFDGEEKQMGRVEGKCSRLGSVDDRDGNGNGNGGKGSGRDSFIKGEDKKFRVEVARRREIGEGNRELGKFKDRGGKGNVDKDDGTPWISILSDLENMLSNKDLSPHIASSYRRVPIKLTRGK